MKKRKILLAGLCMLALPAIGAPRAASAPRTVEITAKKFAFSPAQVTIKKGETVTLKITSLDRTHGFFQRALNLDTDIEPGKTTEITLTPGQAGEYPVICDHYCGWGHGGMAMTIVVQ
jgi:cytochrome c oxidase subunit II